MVIKNDTNRTNQLSTVGPVSSPQTGTVSAEKLLTEKRIAEFKKNLRGTRQTTASEAATGFDKISKSKTGFFKSIKNGFLAATSLCLSLSKNIGNLSKRNSMSFPSENFSNAMGSYSLKIDGKKTENAEVDSFQSTVIDLVKKNRGSWKKGKKDKIISEGNVTIFYNAKKDAVSVKLNKLGQGSFKTGYHLMDFDSGKLSVVTLQNRRQTDLPTQQKLKELSDHPNLLIPFHSESGEIDGVHVEYDFSKLCSGGELNDYRHGEGTSLSQEQKQALTKDILLGLQALHSKNLLHEDMSGGNILLGEPGSQANIMDFDTLREVKDISKHAHKDVFQLGAVLYNIFLGYDATKFGLVEDDGMDANSQREASIRMAAKDPAIYQEMQKTAEGDPLASLIVSMLHPEPAQRISVDAALQKLADM